MPAILRARRSCESPEDVACILQGDRGGNASALPGVNATASTTSKVIQRSAALLYTLAGVQSSRTLVHESLLADAVREEQRLHADLAAIRGEDGAFYATKAFAWLRQCVAQSHEFIALADDDAYVRLSSVVADLLLLRERGLSNVVYGGIEWYTFDRRRAFA